MFSETADLKILFRLSGNFFLIEGSKTTRLPDISHALPLAAIAAHFVFMPFNDNGSGGLKKNIEGGKVPGMPGEFGLSKRELSAREGYAIANFPSFLQIMVEVFGINGFAHPELQNSVEQISQGAEKFFRTGINSEPGYGKFVGLYSITNGLSNDFLSFLIRLYNPPYPLIKCEGILGRYTSGDLENISQILQRDGVYRFPNLIPEDLLNSLIKHAETFPCYPHPESGASKESCVYPAANPQAIKYDFIERELVPIKPIQTIMADESLMGISQAYFGSKPVLDAVAMWWSTTFSPQASSEAAQLYHFDMERIRWLKWFIYLTDVDTNKGPHCFVRGSHRTGRKPPSLMQRGYQRIPDADIENHFPKEDILEITGRKGSIFVEDTSGFHKGKLPVSGPRLVLELEYSNSLYGALISRETCIQGKVHPPLMELAAKFPQFLCKFAIRP